MILDIYTKFVRSSVDIDHGQIMYAYPKVDIYLKKERKKVMIYIQIWCPSSFSAHLYKWMAL